MFEHFADDAAAPQPKQLAACGESSGSHLRPESISLSLKLLECGICASGSLVMLLARLGRPMLTETPRNLRAFCAVHR